MTRFRRVRRRRVNPWPSASGTPLGSPDSTTATLSEGSGRGSDDGQMTYAAALQPSRWWTGGLRLWSKIGRFVWVLGFRSWSIQSRGSGEWVAMGCRPFFNVTRDISRGVHGKRRLFKGCIHGDNSITVQWTTLRLLYVCWGGDESRYDKWDTYISTMMGDVTSLRWNGWSG